MTEPPRESSTLRDILQNERIRPNFASESVRGKALLLFKAGHGYKAVARQLGLSPNTVHDWLRAFKAGRFSSELNRKLYRYTEEAKTKVVEMRRHGASWSEIQKATGVSAASCREWMKKGETKQRPS